MGRKRDRGGGAAGQSAQRRVDAGANVYALVASRCGIRSERSPGSKSRVGAAVRRGRRHYRARRRAWTRFDLGLWSEAPVGEVMSRWRAFRHELPDFSAVALGNQVHGVEVMSWKPAGDGSRSRDRRVGHHGRRDSPDGDHCRLHSGLSRACPGAGWRCSTPAGGALRAASSAGGSRLRGSTGCAVADIVMHCGVGICGPCYEVGSEVLAGCGVAAPGQGPWHLDLRERLTDQGRQVGLQTITTSGWCSAHDRPSFYSHRASGGTDGRMVAYMGMLAGQRGAGAAAHS